MEIDDARKKLQQLGQQHLLEPPVQLLHEIEKLNAALFRQQQAQLASSSEGRTIDSLDRYILSSSIENAAGEGHNLIEQGKVATLIVAGGQGTRLGFDGPKGAFPLSGKSLYQRLIEKVLTAGKDLSVAIMTSPSTDAGTRAHFTKHNRFGLSESQLTIFQQSTLPFMDDQARLFLSSPGQLASGPDGNGRALHHLVSQGVVSRWKEKGVRYVTFIPVDNVLAEPFDPKWIGFHQIQRADVTVKAALRTDADEKVGVLGTRKGRVCVAEYSELMEEQRTAKNACGQLRFSCANLSMFCFSLDFIEKVANETLPLHFARKPIKHINRGVIDAWKSEYFIFDVLPFAQCTEVLVYPREQCFAPLKNAAGPDSPDSVLASLVKAETQAEEHA